VKSIPLHTFAYHHSQLPFEIGKLDQLPPAAQASYPNRHTFAEIFWLSGGAGSHVIDFVAYPIQPNTLYFIAPGQIHYWQIAEPVDGYALLLPPEFFRASSQGLLDELTLFVPGEQDRAFHVPPAEAVAIDWIVQALVNEYAQVQFGQLTVLQALVDMLLVYAQRALLARRPPESSDAPVRLSRRFLRLVEEHYAQLHSVAAYAELLGVTAGHLGDTISEVLGRSAGAVIRERLMLEARRLLVHSDDTSATIAQTLHFVDSSHFSRMFRQATGQSPLQFRSEFRKIYHATRD
jgi:AraC family transcriptional regulator, transcriptional activator of pobA